MRGTKHSFSKSGGSIPTFFKDDDIDCGQLEPVHLVPGVVLHRFVQAVATEVYRD